MNKNRQQLKTGLRAILGGGLREEPAAPEAAETVASASSAPAPDAPASEPEPMRAVVISAEPLVRFEAPVVEAQEAPEVQAKAAEPELRYEEARVIVVPVAQEEFGRKARKKPAAPPPPEPKVKMVPSVRVGTLENPYVRKRDNLPTRKVGIVLPVALAERMQIHCVKARTRPNEFVARAIEALLDELQA